MADLRDEKDKRDEKEQGPSQEEISAKAPPGTPATRDRTAARAAPSPMQPSAVPVPQVPEGFPPVIQAPPTSAPVPHISTTSAPRPPEGPLMVMLRRTDDPEVTMSCMPIDAQDHLASGEWELVPPPDAKRITEANPPESRSSPGSPPLFPDSEK
jgi:hypothetical protein